MGSRVSIALMVIALALLWNTNAANAQSATCPTPAPKCTSSGTLSDLSGSFACTVVYTDSSGTVYNGVLLATADGSGHYTASMSSNSNDTTTSTTFSDFGGLPSGTYCLNTDDTGYFIPTSGGCPLAFVLDNGGTELRVIDTTEGTAGAEICTKR